MEIESEIGIEMESEIGIESGGESESGGEIK